jgi:thiol-disulfide isomerase/thioredoxin
MVATKPLLGGTFICAAVAALALSSRLDAKISPGEAFPSLAEAELSGGSLPETAGKVMLVDFWASWCAPCKASFPIYSRLQADYASRGLSVIAIGVDETSSAFSAFVARQEPLFSTLHDSKRKLVRLVEVPTMPTSYLLDREGKVRFVHPGFHGAQTEKEIRNEIETLLNEKTASR